MNKTIHTQGHQMTDEALRRFLIIVVAGETIGILLLLALLAIPKEAMEVLVGGWEIVRK